MHSLTFNKIVQLLVLSVASGDAARILGVVPFEATSHNILMTSLFKELAARGHEITVYTVKPIKDAPPNYTQIPIDIKQDSPVEDRNIFDAANMNPIVMIAMIYVMSKEMSSQILNNQNIQKLLHSSDDKFDLLISESFFNDAILGLSQKLNVPFVSVVTFSGMEPFKDCVGDPFPYSYLPHPLLSYNDHMTFFQRTYNTLLNVFTKIIHYLYYIPAQDAVMREYLSTVPNLPPLADIIKNTSLLLLNTHFSHGFPRPKVPSVIEVGGMHIKPPKKLPEDIQKYLDDAKDGVIYFSMGSNLKSAAMGVDKREALLKAFAKLKQKVLWKFEENLKNAPKNVKISDWFPQSDILGHQNVRVFMTHGGLLSTQEAMYNSVPLVGIPIFADQQLNVLGAVDKGYAVHLDYHNITEDSVYWTLNEVVNNPKYKLAAQRVSKLFHDQPETPMERAVFWVEYVLRHNGARHLRSAALDLTWYQYYLLDVIAVLLLPVGAFLLLLLWLLRALARLLLRKLHKTKDSMKKRQ